MTDTPGSERASAPIVPCPTCRRPTPYRSSNAWRPFCSERCKLADLGAWASEKFRVEGQAPEDDSEDPGPPGGTGARGAH
jgi:uncharacterized protein